MNEIVTDDKTSSVDQDLEDVELEVFDQVWREGMSGPLEVRIYRDRRRSGPLPAILDVHGGAWTTGDRTNGELYDRALASSGFLVAAIDFEHGPEYQHPTASRDVVNAVRWLRINATQLGLDPTQIGLLGSSSGGHLAMLAGTTFDSASHEAQNVKLEGVDHLPRDVSGEVGFIVALWPVSDPLFRYRYAKRAGIKRLVAAHEGYYVREDAMRAASVPRLVTAGEYDDLPPLLVVQPGEDGNVPVEMTFNLLRAWQEREGYVEYAHYPGLPHAFGHVDSLESRHMIELIKSFAWRHTRSERC